jgi:hypothetical protein
VAARWRRQKRSVPILDFGFWIAVRTGGDTESPARPSAIQNPNAPPRRYPAPEIQNEEVLDLLTRLVEKSLVLYEEREGEERYRLLEMIREYAREQLAAAGEGDALRERHARFFLSLSETAERELTHADPPLWLDRLEREHDNLRAALAWSIEAVDSGQWLVDSSTGTGSEPDLSASAPTTIHYPRTTACELGLRLGCALEEFWPLRGYLKEGLDHLLRLLAQAGAAAPTVARVRALSSAGRFAALQHDLDVSRRLHEESLAMGRALGDRAGIATALLHLGGLAANRWDATTARPLVEEGLAIRRELGDPRGIAGALALLADVRRLEGDLAAERALAEESLAICRALGDRVRINNASATSPRLSLARGIRTRPAPLVLFCPRSALISLRLLVTAQLPPQSIMGACSAPGMWRIIRKTAFRSAGMYRTETGHIDGREAIRFAAASIWSG